MHLSRYLWTGLSLFAALLAAAPAAQPAGWWQWRGPFNTGMAVGSAPLRWSDEAGVRWKTAIPGRGHSTPVFAGNRLFLTTAVPTGRGSAPAGRSRGGGGGGADAGLEHRFEVIAIDRGTGAVAWQRTATVATPHEGYHGTYGSFASNSPVTDGHRVFAFFGSRGLFAYSLDGELLWHKDFGIKLRMDGAFGEGTAPMLHDGRLFILFDHLDRGFLAVLDAASGRELFRIPRPERYNWAAPFIATHDGRRQIVVNGETTRGYDYDSGTELWRAGGLGENSVPQAVQHGDRVFVMSGHTIKMLMAIRLGGRGDLTGTDAITWSTPRGVSYTPSPLLHDSKLYIVGDAGLVSCLDAETGRPFWGPERLPKSYTFKASPVGAAGRIYLATEEGDVVVLRLGDKFEVLATNTLKDQSFIASPIVLDGSIYLRSRTHLFRIDEPIAAGDAMQPEATQAPNTLSPAEKSAGWRLLFDGATSAGWHLFGESELARLSAQRDGRVVGWEVADGALVALAQDGGHDIVTDDEFENVELVLDWKLSPRANSGVFFNVIEQGYKVIYATGPEYQIIDDDGWPSRLEDWQRTGANYAMHPPLARAAKPVGEWNHTRIVVNRGHVEHWLNGAKTADYLLWTPEWEKLVSAGKWKDYPGYGRARKGRIGLQDHGNKVWFRNIKARAIPPRG